MKKVYSSRVSKCLTGLLGVALFLFSSTGYSQPFAAKKRLKVVGQTFASFDGTRIYYEVRGQGEPVVLIHGFTGTGESWKKSPVYSLLLQNGFQVITLDLRGNGQSDKPHEAGAYEHNAEVKDVMDLASKLRLKKYLVAGYSRGSIIAAELITKDKRIKKAVLGGMGADFTNPNWPRRIMFYRALSGDSVPELTDFLKSVQDRNLDQVALAHQQKAQPATAPTTLAKVKIPVLVISGKKDNDNGVAEDLAKLLPYGKSMRVPGNHNTTMQSQAFAEAVTAFLCTGM